MSPLLLVQPGSLAWRGKLNPSAFRKLNPSDPALGSEGHSLTADSICLSVFPFTPQRSVNWAPGAAGAPAHTTGRPAARAGAWRPGCERPAAPPGRRKQQPARCCPSQGNVPSGGPAQEVSPRPGTQGYGGKGPWVALSGLATLVSQRVHVRLPESPLLAMTSCGFSIALPVSFPRRVFLAGGQAQILRKIQLVLYISTLADCRFPFSRKGFGTLPLLF